MEGGPRRPHVVSQSVSQSSEVKSVSEGQDVMKSQGSGQTQGSPVSHEMPRPFVAAAAEYAVPQRCRHCVKRRLERPAVTPGITKTVPEQRRWLPAAEPASHASRPHASNCWLMSPCFTLPASWRWHGCCVASRWRAPQWRGSWLPPCRHEALGSVFRSQHASSMRSSGMRGSHDASAGGNSAKP